MRVAKRQLSHAGGLQRPRAVSEATPLPSCQRPAHFRVQMRLAAVMNAPPMAWVRGLGLRWSFCPRCSLARARDGLGLADFWVVRRGRKDNHPVAILPLSFLGGVGMALRPRRWSLHAGLATQ